MFRCRAVLVWPVSGRPAARRHGLADALLGKCTTLDVLDAQEELVDGG